jgi:NAD(P)H-dependent flavin oxidoreductase YrpB (nitropropane dioxygenase family)
MSPPTISTVKNQSSTTPFLPDPDRSNLVSVLTTPLCRELGIDYPIFNVGFAAGARPELAAAVSNAGGCGVLGSIPADYLRPDIARVRTLTDRPFGVNVIIARLADPEAKPLVEARIAAVLDEAVPILVLFWGDPAPFVEPAHDAGVRVFIQVGSVEEAGAAAAAGVDAVIIQGVEAGGHVKATASIWENLPAAVEAAAPVPVLASGGIRGGEDIARALSLGAQGVSLGTRFVASIEANAHDEYKRRVVAASGEDTVYTEDLFDVGWPDAPHRTLRGKTYEEWDAAGRPPSGERPGEGTIIGTINHPWQTVEIPRYAVGMPTRDFDGDIDYAPLWAGESVGSVREIKPAGEIVRELVAETEAAFPRLGIAHPAAGSHAE